MNQKGKQQMIGVIWCREAGGRQREGTIEDEQKSMRECRCTRNKFMREKSCSVFILLALFGKQGSRY